MVYFDTCKKFVVGFLAHVCYNKSVIFVKVINVTFMFSSFYCTYLFISIIVSVCV